MNERLGDVHLVEAIGSAAWFNWERKALKILALRVLAFGRQLTQPPLPLAVFIALDALLGGLPDEELPLPPV